MPKYKKYKKSQQTTNIVDSGNVDEKKQEMVDEMDSAG